MQNTLCSPSARSLALVSFLTASFSPDGARSPIVTPDQIETVEISIRAFIPKDVADNTVTLPETAGKFAGMTAVPPPPLSGAGHFLTDQRTFSSEPKASSRMYCNFVVDVVNHKIVGEPTVYCDPTVEIDPQTGNELCRQAGESRRIRATVKSTKRAQNGTTIMEIQCIGEARNPCFEKLTSAIPNAVPDIDWDLNFSLRITADGQRCLLQTNGKVDSFPAFEGYAQTENGPVATLFRLSPAPGATPLNLFGAANRNVIESARIDLPLSGTWTTTDPQNRFTLELNGTSGKLTERNGEGKTLTTPCTVKTEGAGFRVERANDDVVLQHLGFTDPKLRKAILAAGPKPSYLFIERKDELVTATWNGIVVTKKKVDNSFERVYQPGERGVKEYEVKRKDKL